MRKNTAILSVLLLASQLGAQSLSIGIDQGNGPRVVEESLEFVSRLSELTGIAFQVQVLPSRRLIFSFTNGKIDASVPNSAGVYKDYADTVVKVPGTVMRTSIYVYSIKPLQFKQLADLKGLRFLKVSGLESTNALLEPAGIVA